MKVERPNGAWRYIGSSLEHRLVEQQKVMLRSVSIESSRRAPKEKQARHLISVGQNDHSLRSYLLAQIPHIQKLPPCSQNWHSASSDRLVRDSGNQQLRLWHILHEVTRH